MSSSLKHWLTVLGVNSTQNWQVQHGTYKALSEATVSGQMGRPLKWHCLYFCYWFLRNIWRYLLHLLYLRFRISETVWFLSLWQPSNYLSTTADQLLVTVLVMMFCQLLPALMVYSNVFLLPLSILKQEECKTKYFTTGNSSLLA